MCKYNDKCMAIARPANFPIIILPKLSALPSNVSKPELLLLRMLVGTLPTSDELLIEGPSSPNPPMIKPPEMVMELPLPVVWPPVSVAACATGVVK